MNARASCQVIGAALALLCMPEPAAFADIVASTERPSFTIEEQEIISRNETLALAVKTDPWAVRQFLDRLKDTPEGIAPDGAEPAADPDLKRFERASPEAALDLLQIIKQAGSSGGGDMPR